MPRDLWRQRHYTNKHREEILEMHARGYTKEEIVAWLEGPEDPELYVELAVEAVLELAC